jgi:mannose-1-phosphate guanylyltransferase
MTNQVKTFVYRTGENLAKQYVRCGRFFHNGNIWFFKTREGVDYGPYDNRTECKYAYEEFIDVVSDQKSLGSIAIDFEDSESKWKVPDIDFH